MSNYDSFIQNLKDILFYCNEDPIRENQHCFTAYNADFILKREEIIYNFEHKIITHDDMMYCFNQINEDDYSYDIILDYNQFNFECVYMLKEEPGQLMLYLLDNGNYKYLVKVAKYQNSDNNYMDKSYTEAIEGSSFEVIQKILPVMSSYTKAFKGTEELLAIHVEKEKLDNVSLSFSKNKTIESMGKKSKI